MANEPDQPMYWIIGVFDLDKHTLRLYGHPDREQLEWWRDGLRTVGMEELKAITRIMGPKTEEEMRGYVIVRGRRAGCEYEILGAVRVVLSWELKGN